MNFYPLLCLLAFCCASIEAWNHLKGRFQRTIEKTELSALPLGYRPQSYDQGFVACAGMHLIPDLFRVVYEFRVHWKVYSPFSVYHCNELDLSKLYIFDELRNVQFVDLCPPDKEVIFGMDRATASKRLRGFFCKVAAVIAAPYNHVMLLDVDTVFFKSPILLFSTPLYAQTGAFFFRDRTLYSSIYDEQNNPSYSTNTAFTNVLRSENVNVSPDYVKNEYYNHGVSYWWRCLRNLWANESFVFLKTCVGQYQESSIVLIHKPTHIRLIGLMEKYIGNFDFGYGDKEMYWALGHISNESWVFEPYEAGQYGDCSGFVMHFDPSDFQKAEDQVTPFYLNGEYLIEFNGKMTAVGSYLARSITRAVKVQANGSMPIHNNCYIKHYRYNNCTCGDHPCATPPPDLSYYVLRAQWITLSLRLQQHTEELNGQCIPVLVEQMHQLNHVFTSKFDRKECFTIGCPLLPLLDTSKYNATDSIWLPSVGKICEPVVFDNLPYTSEFIAKAATHRQPMVPYNTPVALDSPSHTLIQCATLPSLYLMGEDRVFHEFPNWHTFVAMGFDTDQVKRLRFEDCEDMVFGDTLPAV